MARAEHLSEKAALCVSILRERGRMIATAESCTGGMIAAALTDIVGSSAVLDLGFVTYSNSAKSNILGVPSSLIEKHGAVSSIVAEHMAKGALERASASLAIAVTGIAGPGGGSDEKPIGLVFLGLAISSEQDGVAKCVVEKKLFGAIGRAKVREATVIHAFDMILTHLSCQRA